MGQFSWLQRDVQANRPVMERWWARQVKVIESLAHILIIIEKNNDDSFRY